MQLTMNGEIPWGWTDVPNSIAVGYYLFVNSTETSTTFEFGPTHQHVEIKENVGQGAWRITQNWDMNEAGRGIVCMTHVFVRVSLM